VRELSRGLTNTETNIQPTTKSTLASIGHVPCHYILLSQTHTGIVLSSILRPAVERSPFLLVLDARKFEEIARVEFEGVDVPNGIHGIFAPASFPGSSD